ncbi:BNR repeat-containing protein [Aliifodinibius sp. S!AR15-10]|uniref:BNR repeat-containing protein n=1 Tax=Aliifodinibius sp. S!AR15-10 TaxID=2950437 RepID=UPI00285DC55A|nr:BNR repeat-containing protein [Aliifodinibius sp. S!AR15-10]MDR8392878.1 BNR repeat-containing protein [Aliifodinibius sp. S!AR15-10]
MLQFFEIRSTMIAFVISLILTFSVQAQDQANYIPVGKGWAKSSVNTTVFRQASVVSHENLQYTAYYDPEGNMVLAKRKHGSSEWEKRVTRYSGNVKDAHNSISLGVDGRGLLHVSWDHHGNELNYAQSQQPGSLQLSPKMPMTGQMEKAVTYPQFYHLENGDLLFVYRDGSSGNGNVMLNRYDVKEQNWEIIAHPLIDGEGERNAYVNTMAIDEDGGWHISWTWRETWDVSTNHDMMYAISTDQGQTWQTSTGKSYTLPITRETAEVVHDIPQGSELINQTSMTVNRSGEPVIASYWSVENESTPQYRIVWKDGNQWKSRQVSNRQDSFSLSGGGTKRIPISRPQVLAGTNNELHVVFRDFEQGSGITVATSHDEQYQDWILDNIYEPSVGMWEPSYDPVMWQQNQELHLFGQKVGQGDGETLEELVPQEVFILEWVPSLSRN